jgi:hypothetical protein
MVAPLSSFRAGLRFPADATGNPEWLSASASRGKPAASDHHRCTTHAALSPYSRSSLTRISGSGVEPDEATDEASSSRSSSSGEFRVLDATYWLHREVRRTGTLQLDSQPVRWRHRRVLHAVRKSPAPRHQPPRRDRRENEWHDQKPPHERNCTTSYSAVRKSCHSELLAARHLVSSHTYAAERRNSSGLGLT